MNSLQILVTNQICPKIELHENVILNTTETFIGTEVSFSCPTGYNLIRKMSILCRDDGNNSKRLSFVFNHPIIQPPGPRTAPPAAPSNALP